MSHTNILLESGTNELEVVEFYIDEVGGYRAHYGVNVAKVLEILRKQSVTSMPGMPHPAVMGAFKHRDNTIVPLIDLARYLDRDRIDSAEPKVIVTEFNEVVTAFLVSGVNRIHRMSWEDVEAPSEFLQKTSANSITGVVRLEGRVVFLLDLEMIVADLDVGLAIRMEACTPERAAGKTYTILHADDSGSVRNLVKSLLEASNFKVIQFTNGRDAWEYLEKQLAQVREDGGSITDRIQGIISDIEMPQMDGHNLCKRIKESPDLRLLPVALFSSLITEKLEHKGKSVGADAQFAKPDLQRLSDFMLQLLEARGL
ncbi:chemotaxis protein [Desulfovibrio subterraneus]|jgi:two-component system chemotaxis response regulator CheV|uniref:Chemotaxis protein CheV n=1 Tax=Desulfovibrio subterraneus TaxID=2718620 RepID=A0A7J0BHS0_9BACT|nr:chemotaxis protein [Desulfovibrio subterraneus]WBF67018.1 chemotaxis protein [Desulfovibrio subterraneus]GFM32752.1 chemotaxis protein CheV [Desulfovibrio subterraneus]